MVKEIRQLKVDKTKEKGSQHDLENAADKEETLEGRCPQNTKQCFMTMVDVMALLEREKAKVPKERFYSRRPPYPIRLLRKPYPDRYELLTFSKYDSRKGSAIEHVSKFVGTM